ncbi:MAG: signal recognition particle protein [Alphaproteobacteria bacterium CG_4_10_14_0_8_um_filter_53_9]|nr:MAG: signal recognition particle protein [Alphaproteobacteria bacterium CG_4_10_14_0_8_um_filter_53_9]
MFDFLSEKLQSAFKSLKGKGILTEADVEAALRELRLALLEADVSLSAIKHLTANVRQLATGEKVLSGINPGEQVTKIVYDQIVELLGTEEPELTFPAPLTVILMVGLQGSGKTTSSAKIAQYCVDKYGRKPVMASLDVYRPAAIAQLEELGKRLDIPTLSSTSTSPQERTKQALSFAKESGANLLILDTAGRTDLNEELMEELKDIHKLSVPHHVILCADAQAGHSAVDVAEAFKKTIPVSGLVLTRVDGDARGGAALSMRHVTGVPILFLGVGEAVGRGNANKIEPFRPHGLAGRILGQGDVLSLVEKVQAASSEEDNAALEKKMMSGKELDFNDISKQLKMMQRMGGMGNMLGLLPGMGALKGKLEGKMDDKMLARQQAVISSMTPKERKNPKLLNAKRRMRIAKGCGLQVADVNKLVKMQEGLNQMTKMLRKGGLSALTGAMGKGGGFPKF